MSADVPSHLQTPDEPVAFKPPAAFATLLNRLQPSPETVVLVLAVAIGGGTGLAVVLFHYLIEQIQSLMLEGVMGLIAPLGAWTLACIPVLGGAIVGLMRWHWQDLGPSISSLVSATRGLGRVSPDRAVAKTVAASVSLGTGASLGPEGPSVEVGANIGVILGQALQVSQERQRLLLGAGAAAGLAAGFNAPIAGVFFALEVVLGTTFAASAVSVVLLAAVVSALIAQIGQGGHPAFTLPAYEVRSFLELPLYLGLGFFACLVSLGYTQSIQLAQRFFKGELPGFGWMGRLPLPLKPAMGGLCVGVTALQFPQILGIGYETIEAMLRDVHFSLPLLGALLVTKLLLTAVSSGSGLVGGLFAPAMFLGASLGSAYGRLLPLILPLAPGAIAPPPAYAMVGMAAVLAASARAPLTAILLLFELTRDYRIILPLMAAVGLSAWLIERFKPLSQNASALQASGLNMQSDESLDLLRQLPVYQVMHQNFLSLPASMSVIQAGLTLTRHQSRSALVVDEMNELLGIVTLQDIRRGISQGEEPTKEGIDLTMMSDGVPSGQRVGDICTHNLLFAYSDETTSEAIARMAARGLRQLPVVDRSDPKHVLGLLEQDQISLAYSLAMTRQALKPYLETVALSEPLPLPTTKQSSAA
jgi:H+/Cl- antiporter ClcA/CBS domain-containing protein